jgi:hypothetical protein
MQTVIFEEGKVFDEPDQPLIRELRSLIETAAFQSPDPTTRVLGMNSLWHIAHESLVNPLIECIRSDPSDHIRRIAARALGAIRHSKSTSTESAMLVERVLGDQLLIEKSIEVQESIKSAIAGN